jgi:hypothetical protein
LKIQKQKRRSGEKSVAFAYMEGNRKHSVFFAAAALTAAAITAAAAGIGAADALFAAFLGLVDVEGRAADDGDNQGDEDVVNRIHRLTSFR